jgi:membrane associated rhomboid family serine protease
MLFPYNTDAPVYHWPFATVGLIVVNVIAFIALEGEPLNSQFLEFVVLPYGQGFTPVQWITSKFSHAGYMHLLGNMVVLWTFGLVVEGKLGWQRFLACYLGLAVAISVLEQLVMWNYAGSAGGSLGASSVIFSLIAMAAVWAPRNDVSVFYWFGVVGTFDVPIAVIASIYVGLDLFWALLFGGGAATSLLHLSGALLGFPLGILMLKRKVVDCEGWDMFHVWRGDPGGKEEAARKEADADRCRAEQHAAEQMSFVDRNRAQLLELLAAGHVDAALKLYGKLLTADHDLQLARDELRAIIRGLHKQERWSASAPFMAELADRFPAGSEAVRLKLAQICVVALNRPGRALDLLAALDSAKLTPEQSQLSRQIARKAESMQAVGTVELDDGGW